MTRKSRLKEIQSELDKLNAEKILLEKTYKPECRVADAIHDSTCNANHTDGCGYEYESWEKPGSEKKRYLTKANNLLELLHRHCETDTPLDELAEEIIETIGGY